MKPHRGAPPTAPGLPVRGRDHERRTPACVEEQRGLSSRTARWRLGRRAGLFTTGLLLGLTMVAAGRFPVAAQEAPLTRDEICDLTPRDGSWGDWDLSITDGTADVDLTPFAVSVTDALVSCTNLYQHRDGTWIYVAVFLMPSEEAGRDAGAVLRASAAQLAPVEEFATPLLGDEAWIAQFPYEQLAFTRVGPFLIGGNVEEAYDYSRADYRGILIERMGFSVTAADGQSEVPGDGGATIVPSSTSPPPTGPPAGTDEGSGGLPGVLVGAAAVAAAVATAAGIQRARRGGRRTDPSSELPEEEQEEEEDDRDRSVVLELTHPAGRSPKVFQFGWVFGARCIVDGGTSDRRDLSDRVRWSGDAVFTPPVGRLSRPAFRNHRGQVVTLRPGSHPRTITLSVEVDGATHERTFSVAVVSTAGYARVGDNAFCPANAHGCMACPHPTVGPIITGSPNVLLSGLPAARVGDVGVSLPCCGPNMFSIVTGDAGVLIDGRPAAELGSRTEHCFGGGGTGKVIMGDSGWPPD